MFRLWQIFKRNKYLITSVFFISVLTYFDKNSFYRRYKQGQEIQEMQRQVADYRHQYIHDTRQLNELEHDPSAILRIARERYLMKAADEDVYIFNDQQQ